MKNIALKVFWTNSPMPVSHKIKNPDITLDIPFGNILFVNSGTGIDVPVKSVNEKTGHVVLSASDVLADPFGSAEIVKTQLENQIKPVQILAEKNQLNLSKKADQFELEQTQIQVESNRLLLLNKADLTAIAMLTTLIDTKADQHYVQEQIANLVNGDQSIINAIQEIATALKENEDLIQALDYTVANRVRFDIANQALTALQKFNARTNINAEESGTAAMLIAQITAQTLGAATAAQGAKADTALQSADIAPVAFSGQFNSLGGQNRIFDVVYSAYIEGTNSVINASDSLGIMLSKLQAQIKSKGTNEIEWVKADRVGVISDGFIPYATLQSKRIDLEFAKINGMLYMRGGCELTIVLNATKSLIRLNPDYYVRSYFYNNVANISAQHNCYYRINPAIENAFVILSTGMVLTVEDIPFSDQSLRWWNNDENVGKIGNWLIGGQGGIICLGYLISP